MLFVFFRFHGAIWENYPPQKRLKVLQALEKKMAKKQGRPWVNVEIHPDENWPNLGMFQVRGNRQVLYINNNLVLNHAYRFFAMETIIHEGRHAYQYYVINNKNLHFYNVKERRWKENWKGYIPSEENLTDYNIQAVERDAQGYTLKMLKRLAFKFRNEEAFHAALYANQRRYDDSEFEARKKYGAFYKRKIDKKISSKNDY